MSENEQELQTGDNKPKPPFELSEEQRAAISEHIASLKDEDKPPVINQREMTLEIQRGLVQEVLREYRNQQIIREAEGPELLSNEESDALINQLADSIVEYRQEVPELLADPSLNDQERLDAYLDLYGAYSGPMALANTQLTENQVATAEQMATSREPSTFSDRQTAIDLSASALIAHMNAAENIDMADVARELRQETGEQPTDDEIEAAYYTQRMEAHMDALSVFESMDRMQDSLNAAFMEAHQDSETKPPRLSENFDYDLVQIEQQTGYDRAEIMAHIQGDLYALGARTDDPEFYNYDVSEFSDFMSHANRLLSQHEKALEMASETGIAAPPPTSDKDVTEFAVTEAPTLTR